MATFEPGSVVLVRFPFTELTSTKRRPALIVSPPLFAQTYGDIVLIALTSRPQSEDLIVRGWREAGLPKATWFKPLIATIAVELVDRELGRLSQPDRATVIAVLDRLIDPSSFR